MTRTELIDTLDVKMEIRGTATETAVHDIFGSMPETLIAGNRIEIFYGHRDGHGFKLFSIPVLCPL